MPKGTKPPRLGFPPHRPTVLSLGAIREFDASLKSWSSGQTGLSVGVPLPPRRQDSVATSMPKRFASWATAQLEYAVTSLETKLDSIYTLIVPDTFHLKTVDAVREEIQDPGEESKLC